MLQGSQCLKTFSQNNQSATSDITTSIQTMTCVTKLDFLIHEKWERDAAEKLTFEGLLLNNTARNLWIFQSNYPTINDILR